MRIVVVVVGLALAGCGNQKRAAPAEPPPNRDPYRNVTPAKIKQQVEETERKHEDKIDKLQESAK